MDWLKMFRPARTARQIEGLATEVAQRCEPEVRARIGSQATNASVAETRGYVRALAGGAVRRETDVLLSARRELPSALRSALVRRATDQVVALVADNLIASGVSQAAARRAG